MERGPAAKAVTEPAAGGQIEVLGTFAGRRRPWASPSDL